MLGRINLASTAIDLHQYADTFREDVFGISRQMISLVKEFIGRNGQNLGGEDINRLQAFADSSERALETYKKTGAMSEYGKYVIPVHGDFNSRNLVFSEDGEVIAVLDFDNSSFDDVVHDIAEGLINFSFIKYAGASNAYSLPDSLDAAAGKAFLDGYDASNRAALESSRGKISYAASAVLIELLCLGIIRGDYKFSDIDAIEGMPEYVRSAAEKLLR